MHGLFHGLFQFLMKKTRKPNKTWVDKGSEFFNRSMKLFLQNNNIEVYSTHNEAISVIAERFIWTWKIKSYNTWLRFQKLIVNNNNFYVVNKCNNTYYNTIKMKPVDVKLNTYIRSSRDKIIKILNLKFVILIEYWNIKIFLWKVSLKIGQKKFFWLKKLETLYRGHVINDLNWEDTVGICYKKELQKANQKSVELK